MINQVYVNSPTRTVSLQVPVAPSTGTIDVTVWFQGEEVYTVDTVTESNGMLFFNLPFFLSQSDKELQVRWVFNYVEGGQTYEYDSTTTVFVTTPILPIEDIKAILDNNATEEEAYAVEKAVRYIIQAHTGQDFGKFIGKKSITGSGDGTLRLPSRLIKLNSVNDNLLWSNTLVIRGGGWYLTSRAFGLPSLRADYHGIHENPYTSSAPIGVTRHNFIKHVEYVLDGEWGWNNVPPAVQEAAKLLVNDYACGDSMYRDRFLTSMTAADWRIQFHEGAFTNTGNVRANQLLAEFVVRRGWVVL